MQTSNKILLGTLLTTVLIITSLHLALYAKIKSGDFAASNEVGFHSEYHSLPDIKYVSITGLVNCQLVPAGKPGMEIDKVPGSRLSFKVVNDTLFLKGDSTYTIEDYEKGIRNHQSVKLVLPSAQLIKLFYGALGLTGSLDTANAPSYSIELAHAHLGFPLHKSEPAKMFFKQLNLVVNQSNLELNDRMVIDTMHVRAVESELLYHRATINQLNMDVDSNSTLSMRGKNIKSITLNSKP